MKNPVRVLHIIRDKSAQALGPLIKNLAEALRPFSIESDLLYIHDNSDQDGGSESPIPSENVLSKNKNWDWAFVSRFRRLMAQKEIHIVHTHDVYSLLNVSWPARLAGKILLHTRHARLKADISALNGLAHHRIIACSQDIKLEFLKHCRLTPEKVRVIYDGIVPPAIHANGDQETKRKGRLDLGLKEDSLVLVNVGRLIAEEDQASLLKTVRKLRQKKVNVELLILGQGPLQEALTTLCKEFKIDDGVKFLGDLQAPAKDRALATADVTVFSFNKEVYPFQILEAMALAKPIIATKIGSNVEIVSEGETGFLVPCGFPERTESAVMRFYANRSLAAKVGASARREFEKKFSLERMAQEYEGIYKGVLSIK